ncbi:uncharacterized protein LOC128121498 [Peromyscus californicus insignis]|uniref:uncharacterized protein LOC128121498 n=1 Tax=Peromyscus californicus insignis TaxID=564181 RepID=UPI0022A66963|nr:uncharacterized protein LOC128121498 [Peromyscus californicus insignis]
MWLFPALLLFLPGFSTAQDPITGPNMVRGQEQGSLTVRCPYDSSWKDYNKYWCRGADWSSCEIFIQTDASEQLVKKDCVSIRDDQTDFIVTVTMEDLRISDAGIYWCAIERTGRDPHFKVNVNIHPAPETSTITMITMAPVLTSTPLTTMAPVLTSTPSTTMAPVLTSTSSTTMSPVLTSTPSTTMAPVLTSTPSTTMAPVLTSTPPTMENFGNYGEAHTSTLTWSLLSSVYFQLLVFLEVPLLLSMLIAVLWVNRPQRCSGGGEVGLVKVHSSDAWYREKYLHVAAVRVQNWGWCFPDCVPLRGPSKVTGTVGESLSVRCQYEEEHKTNDKYWCRVTMLPCKGLVKTRASKEAGKGRVSIRDHPANLTFTVTLENLTLEDAGTYKCGVDMPLIDDSLGIYPFLGIDDDSLKVVVSVVPAPVTVSLPKIIANILGSPTSSPVHTQSSMTTEDTTPGPSLQPRPLLSSIYFQVLVFLEVPLLLSMLSAVLWVNRPQRDSGEMQHCPDYENQ